jgi:hypothetical protein
VLVAAEVITEYAFGRSIPVLDKDDMAAEYLEVLQNGVRIHPVARQFPSLMRNALSLPEWMMGDNKMLRASKHLDKSVTECAKYAFDEARREQDEKESSTPTVLYEMLNASALPPEEKTFARLKNDASIFIGAGKLSPPYDIPGN